jgi:hypothetical protein
MIDWSNGQWPRTARIAAELTVGYALLTALDTLLTGGTGFAAVQPNPLGLPVLVMALAYSTGPALAAAVIASTLWLTLAHHAGVERDYLDHLFHLSLPPLLWFVTAVGVGEVTMMRAQRRARVERRMGVARRNVTRLTEAFHALARTNRALQVEVATNDRTIGHVIATATTLNAPDPAVRREAMARLIALAARTSDFTCYRYAANEARAWLRGPGAIGRSETLPEPLVALARQWRGPVHVGRSADREVLDGVGVVAIPLHDGDPARIIGCLVLHSLPFAAMNAHALAEMAEIGGWLGPLLREAPRIAGGVVRPTGLVA